MGYVSILSISKKSESIHYKLIDSVTERPCNFIEFENSTFNEEPWDFNINQDLKVKVYSKHLTLDDIASFTYGVITGFDGAFLIPSKEVKDLKLEVEITKNFIRPQNYKKYFHLNQTFSLIYPYSQDNSILEESVLKTNYPHCYNFLLSHKEKLENRKDSRVTIKEKGLPWYSIMRRVDLNDINNSKIVFYDVGMQPNFILDNNKNIFGGGTSHSLRVTDERIDLRYILGLLNSKLMEWIIYDICPVKMGDARKYGLNYIKKLPIPIVSKEIQEIVIQLVERVIEQKKKDIDTVELENQIDQIIYELYGLTEEEIKIVEANA